MLIFLSTQGKCDAIDYWQVFLNGKVIGYFREYDKNRYIRLKADSIKTSDTITIRYCADTRCGECPTELTIWNKIEKLLTVKGVEDCRPISFTLNSLYFSWRKHTELVASYVEHRGDGGDYGVKKPLFYIQFY